MFCKHCGKGIPILEGNVLDNCFCDYPHKDYPLDTFHKFLGTAEITEVFKIEMFKKQYGPALPGFEVDCDKWNNFLPFGMSDEYAPMLSELAKLDGFKSAEDMFKWFDEKYDLSKPKQFWVYRWKWLE